MPKLQRQTVGQAVVRFLANQWSERDGHRQRLIPGMWAIFGHGNVAGLGQALEALGDTVDLPTYRAQNEQAMVHAAAAYAKHQDRLATFACTASVGPGSSNMITAAAGATINRVPVLLLPSDYFANRRVDPVLQQLEHPSEHDVSVNDSFRPIARFFTRISRPEQLLAALPEAMRVLTDPVETGAVVVSLPEDVQAEAFDWPTSFFEPRTWRVRRPPPEADAIHAAAHMIRNAKQPVMVVGGGVRYAQASEAVAQFAAHTGIPLCETQAGKGAIAWDHPQNAGPVGSNGGSAANALARDADLVIAVGTRLSDFTTASMTAFQNPDVRFIGVNVAAMDAHKLGALALVADAREGMRALQHALQGHTVSHAYAGAASAAIATWRNTVTQLRTPRPGALAQAAVLGAINDAAAPAAGEVDAVIVNAAGSMPGDLLKLWRSRDARSYHVEYGFSCMGYEIPAGLGIKLAEPNRHVIVMVGDGTYLMMNSEIVTAVAEGLHFTIVVVENHGFQSIHGLQRAVGVSSFTNERRNRDPNSGRLTGPVTSVDFVAHAASMGAHAQRVETIDALQRAIRDAKERQRVSVVVVDVDPEQRTPGFDSWWDVPVAEVGEGAQLQAARERYQAGVAQQRAYAARASQPESTEGEEA